jgi:hypothetical protein
MHKKDSPPSIRLPKAIGSGREATGIVRSVWHGHVAVVSRVARRTGLDRLIVSNNNCSCDFVLAMTVTRAAAPAARLRPLSAGRNNC